LLFCLTGCGIFQRGQVSPLTQKPFPTKAKFIQIEKPLSKLPEYESLTYKIKMIGIPVGYMKASIKGIKKFKGRDVYELELLAWTNKVASKIFRIEDRYVSYLDAEHFYPLQFEEYRQEGKYRRDAITEFDHENGKGRFTNLLNKSVDEFEIPAGVQDLLSGVYYFRMLSLPADGLVKFHVSTDAKVYQFQGVVQSKRFIRLPQIGKVESFHFQPYIHHKGKKVKKGRLKGYFSTDSKRMPLLTVMKAPLFAKLTITLYEIE